MTKQAQSPANTGASVAEPVAKYPPPLTPGLAGALEAVAYAGLPAETKKILESPQIDVTEAVRESKVDWATLGERSAALEGDSPVAASRPTGVPLTEGVKYDVGKPPLHLLSPLALKEIAKVLDFGQRKYAAHNWRKGMAWTRLIRAGLGHLLDYLGGEDFDPETGLSHLAHAGCCVMFLLEYQLTKNGTDDRYKGVKS